MRKSLQKTRLSGLSSKLPRLPAGLLVGAARRAGAKPPEGFGVARPVGARAVGRNGASGASASRATPGVDVAAPRDVHLRLLEGFLSRTEIADCAQLALQWLADELHVAR